MTVNDPQNTLDPTTGRDPLVDRSLPRPGIAPSESAPNPPANDSDLDDNASNPEEDLLITRVIDPALLWLVFIGVTILGLNGLAADVRYAALWTTVIVGGILSILFDQLEVEIPTASDMAWGIGYGLLLSLPLVVIAVQQLQQTSQKLFGNMTPSFVFQSAGFMMSTGDTLFFRGAMQPTRGLLFTAIASTLWSMVVFFPQLQVVEYPLVAVVIGFAFLVLNFLYGYIRRRFGLFASWTCEITVNLMLLFVVRFV